MEIFPDPPGVLLQNAVILSQGMSLPFFRQQNPAEVRVMLKPDPEHVERFALEPVGHSPDGNNALDRLAIAQRDLYAQPLVAGDVNCGGGVNSIDALLVLQLDAELLDALACEEHADVNADGDVNSLDALLILQYVAGLINSLPI